jgi:hypothetical protein
MMHVSILPSIAIVIRNYTSHNSQASACLWALHKSLHPSSACDILPSRHLQLPPKAFQTHGRNCHAHLVISWRIPHLPRSTTNTTSCHLVSAYFTYCSLIHLHTLRINLTSHRYNNPASTVPNTYLSRWPPEQVCHVLQVLGTLILTHQQQYSIASQTCHPKYRT